jgi:hypothetical protein
MCIATRGWTRVAQLDTYIFTQKARKHRSESMSLGVLAQPMSITDPTRPLLRVEFRRKKIRSVP